MHLRKTNVLPVLGVLLMFGRVAAAAPITIYDEAVQGDFSGVFSAPTSVTLSGPESRIIGRTGAGSTGDFQDYFTFTIPVNEALTSLTLLSSSLGSGALEFIALAAGPAFTFAPAVAAAHLADMLGYSHFSPVNNGTDLLPLLKAGAGAAGFNIPLGPGSYTVWIQDSSPGVSTYDLQFNVVPEPGTVLLTLSGLAVLVGVRRRRRA